jgi:protein-tyrosine phosphatase
MIDLHCHILPGMDDGAASAEAAVEMVRLAAENGTTDIVATPHSNLRYRFEPAAVESAITELQAKLDAPVRLHYGCEMHLTPENVDRAIREPWYYTLGHRGYLLVEFCNNFVPRNSGQILRRLRAAGARPVIAHPERNPILRERAGEIAAWVGDGCLVQVTAQSLLGQFGRSAETAARNMLSGGLVHCVASDAHDPSHRPPLLQEARRMVAQEFGEESAHALFEKNPRAVLLGEGIAHGRMALAKKAWYSFW